MGRHPLNLALRFILELAALFAVGQWAWTLGSTHTQSWILLIISLALFMSLWGTFNVPGDPSRSRKAPVVVRGWIRLVLEIGLFLMAAYAFYAIGNKSAAITLTAFLIIHYLLSYDRIKWLLDN